VALDRELNREVAFKQIQDRHADDPETRKRFVQEAEITGRLEHLGIVPVYGLGSYADGRPFYAMRFIHGDSLRTVIKQFHGKQNSEDSGSKTEENQPANQKSTPHSVAFRQLIGRFIDVCQAIEYSHSRGILHRDLKPGNICWADMVKRWWSIGDLLNPSTSLPHQLPKPKNDH
jgi:serine/threonine protein kinase